MRAIMYAGGELVTGDAIAAAVLDYAEALGANNGTAQVSFPIRSPDGARGDATIVVGPASQIVSKSAGSSDEPELTAPSLVAAIRARAVRLRYGQPDLRERERDDGQPVEPYRWVDDL